jgi:hypothetical protein
MKEMLCEICYSREVSNDPSDQADVCGERCINVSGPHAVCHDCAGKFNEYFEDAISFFLDSMEGDRK